MKEKIIPIYEIRDDCYNTTDVTNFIDDMEKKIFLTTRERRTGDLKPVIEVANEVVKNIEKTSQLKGDITGLDTGYTMLNRYTLGLQPSELVILAARPSMGKTALALNIALNVARNEDKPYVAFFSLEMGVEQLVMRLLSSISAINNNELKLGRLAGGDWKKLDYAVNSLSKINLLLDDSGTVNVADLRSKCRKMKSDGKLDLVIVDYLQLLSGSKNRGDNRVQEVSEISRTLKEIARELKIPVLALSQLSRTVETRPDKRPIMADLRESGSIEQDADIVLFLYRDDYYTKEKSTNPNTATVIIAKNRSGTTGDFNLLFHKETTTFTNLSSSEESYEE